MTLYMSEQKKTKPEEKPVETKAVAKPLTHEQLRGWITKAAMADCDPKNVLDRLAKSSQEWRENDKPSKEVVAKMHSDIGDALPIVALETHYLAAESVSQRYRPFVVQFAQDIVAEYQCKTPSEKALAQSVAIAYGRILELSKSFNSSQHIEFLSSEKNGYYGMIAKELDRAHRQFASSLLVLKQMKSPTLEVNIRAKTAFIAQNQQVNATSPDLSAGNEKKVYETVDPK